MFDPREGVGPDGTIHTGVDRSRVAPVYEPLLTALAVGTAAAGPTVSTYLYGSVATGMARLGTSDVDVLTVDLPRARATVLRHQLSEQFAGLTRGVEVAVAQRQDFRGDGDEAYSGRVFLRHYCIHLTGPDLGAGLSAFPADVRAARGLNGDIGRSRRDWVTLVRDASARDASDSVALGRRVARKTLLAVAGLVSVHDGIWTTDRGVAARRWALVRPTQADGLSQLLSWSEAGSDATAAELGAVLAGGGIVDLVVQDFRNLIGLCA